MEQLQTWWVTALYMPIDGDSCMEIPGDCEVVKAADAQATIAALQARAEQAERLVALQAQEILQRRQTLGDLAHLHQQQSKELTQRTAELEAAKRGIDTARTRYDNLSTESYKQIAVLQAELERVRGGASKS